MNAASPGSLLAFETAIDGFLAAGRVERGWALLEVVEAVGRLASMEPFVKGEPRHELAGDPAFWEELRYLVDAYDRLAGEK